MSLNSIRKVGVSVSALAGLVLAASVVTFRAQADQWDKMTLLTLDEPTQVSNTYLEPGTYMFKLVNSTSDRHIVQIFTQDRSQLLGTILAIPAYRPFTPGDTEITFWETPPGTAKAVRAWYYPGDNFGQEFRYPTNLRQLALVTPLPSIAPAAPAASEAALTPSPIADQPASETPAPQVAEQAPPEPAPVEIAQNAPQETAPQAPVEIAQNNAPQDNSAQASQSDDSQALPKTASPYPLFGLGGLLALGLYGLLRIKEVA
jgi:hypothetical protein